MKRVRSAGTAGQMRTSSSWFNFLWSHPESETETMNSLTAQNTRPAEWQISRAHDERARAPVMPYIKDEGEAIWAQKLRTDVPLTWTGLKPSSGRGYQDPRPILVSNITRVTCTTAEKYKRFFFSWLWDPVLCGNYASWFVRMTSLCGRTTEEWRRMQSLPSFRAVGKV